jgi:N6-adenosine-specific RNA methylase IME4
VRAHAFAAIFPALDDAELQALAEDIGLHGLRLPIWTFEGQVLDGRNRLAACKLARIDPKFQPFKGTRDEALAFVWSANIQRRHLNSGQKALALVRFESLQAKQARAAGAEERKQAGRRKGGGPPGRARASRDAKAVERKSSTALAKAAGVSPATIERAQALDREAPAKADEVIKGDKTLSQALREHRREHMRERVTLPPGKYRVLYADPPWSYGNHGVIDDADAYGRAERHYPSMTIAELCTLDVQALAADDAVLFLWVTSPLLGECWPVIKAWGFEYKTSLVWDKVEHNFGNYVSVRHELLLLCTRGSCLPDHPTPMPDSVLSIPRSTVHSQKPEEFRALIDRLYDGDADQKIELFARAAVPGWTVWGNEAAA